MKYIAIITLMSFVWFGCGDNQVSQDNEISELMRLVENDEILQLDIMDTDGAIDEEYTDGLDVDDGLKMMADTLWPHSDYRLRFGRQILSHNRDFNFDIQGDTAYGDLSKSLSGNFYVIAYDSNHAMVDSFVKAFDSEFTRRVRFTRNDSTANRPWRIDAFTMGTGGSGTKVGISSINCYNNETGDELYSFSNDEAGSSFFLRDSVPTFAPGQVVRIEMTVENEEPVFVLDSLDSGEKALMHFGRGRGERGRRRMNDSGLFADETAGDNIFSMVWRAHRLASHHGNRRVFITHFNVIDNATLFISDGGFNTSVWSFPYRIERP